MKIDIHTHILPKNWPDLKERYGYGGFVQLEHHAPNCARMVRDGEVFREIQANCWDPESRLNECERFGVQVQVLSTVPVMFNYWAKPEDTLDLSRLLNDSIAEIVSHYPKHFVGLGTLPLQKNELAIQELERCVKIGLAGVQIGSNVNGLNLGEQSFFPFFEACESLGTCIFIHPWDMLGKDRHKKYWMSWLVGMPAETATAICSMIFGGVFERFPKLRVAFAHGGGSFPSTLGRIEHGFQARPDICAIDNPVNPRQYLGKFYLDSLVHDPQMLHYLIALVGAEKIALGTDYPFPLGENEPGQLIESMSLDSQVKERLLSETALEWLGK
ncbi:MAG: amidohydrolase family protein, partial [Planctomycetota bacterium]